MWHIQNKNYSKSKIIFRFIYLFSWTSNHLPLIYLNKKLKKEK